MDIEINPFHELYVTETASPAEFVKLFSPLPVKHALMLFQQGNVVLKGTQGSGKSMLLSLLKPEIRKAFCEHRIDYPVQSKSTNFIGAGINLIRCGALDIGQRPISDDPAKEEHSYPLYFSDFFNYWIVRDLLGSLEYIADRSETFNRIVNRKKLDKFAAQLAGEACWFGYLKKVQAFYDLVSRIDKRIRTYRLFNQYNIKRMPSEIERTKTGIGEPISRAAQCLLRSGVIKEGTQVYVRVDQYETLMRSPELRPNLGKYYRQIINKALSTRDPNISYRIGTRSYAWEEDVTVYGTSLKLEKERDYREIDLDEALRRKEDTRTWKLPDFATDVFKRRLQNSGFEIKTDKPLIEVFGKSPHPKALAMKYSRDTAPGRALRIDIGWPKEWRDILGDLYEENRISAMLAQAWARQKGGNGKKVSRLASSPPQKPHPWERPYWKKERIRQALMQLASNCGQRLIWQGEESILSLSMGSILVFISICQHIWDTFLRSQRGLPKEQKRNPINDGIEGGVQSVAIHTASEYWYKKITEQPGGNDRQRFIDYIGRSFQKKLLEDRAMSYPGHNGFSLLKEELDDDKEVARFLGDAVDCGDLFSFPHTTKTKDRRQRIKWYLNPVLSPYFRIPETHIKEPIYTNTKRVRDWMIESNIQIKPLKEKNLASSITSEQQMSLFDELDKKAK
jgi:hypothetical protein